MSHGRCLVDNQPFDLMKHRGMGGIVIRTVSPARRNNAYRQRMVFHRAYLHRRRMGSDHKAVVLVFTVGIRNIKGILHLTGRMVGRHIQRIEIMELVFNIRSFGNFKTHFAENRRNFFINFADRMNAPLLFGTNRQRYVNSLGRKLGIKFLGSQLFLSGVKRLLHFRLQNIEVPALLLFFLD